NESGTGLVYSTYLGAEDDDYGMAIAADSLGNAYITGLTRSFTFPLLRPLQAFQERTGGGDAFVTKLTPAGNLAFDASRPSTEQPFSTYLGGGGRDVGRSITVDPLGNTIVTGLTDSLNLLANRQVVFPPFQPNYGGGARDQFVGVINLSAAAFNYLTYLGGDGDEGGLGPDTGDIPYGIAIGVHTLPNPTRTFPGFFSGPLANKFGPDFGAGVVTDPQGNAYVVGGTNSQNFFTTPGAFQRTPGGDNDAFVTKFNTSGQPIFSTLLGGSGNDGARGVAVDTNRNIYITGYTASGNFPTAGSTVFQAANAGGLDAFLTKMNVDGAGLAYSTYLGGSGNDIGYSVAVNTTFNPYVVGNTTSPDFPRSDQIQGSLLGGRDMFVTKFIPEGSTQEYSTYLGGFFQDFGNAVGIDPRGGIIVYGSTWEDNALSSFPSTLGTFQQRMIPPFAGRFYGRIAPYGRSNTRSDFGEYPLVDAVVVRITNAPLQPTNLRVVAGSITESGVVLEWDDNSINETGFVIERSENGGAFVRIGSANNPTVGENVTRFEDTGRKPDTRYSYRVAAVNADGLSAYSNQIDIRTLPIPPAAPTNLQATSSLTPTPRVTLTFTDTSTDETGFRVEKSTNGTTFTTLTTLSPNTTTYVDTAVEVGRTYSYRVRAVRLTAGGITAVSGPTNTVTITLTAPPATPVLVSAIATGPEQVTLTFTDTSTDEQGFRIQRSEGNGAFVQVGQTGPGQTTFVDNSVDAESTYRYRVVAFNSSGVGNPSNILSVTTPGFPPAAPSRLTAVVTSNRSIELRWSFGGDADVFEVQRRAAAEQEFTAIGTAAGNTRTFTDPNVSPNVTYEYRVVARNENGDSNPSNTASARITTGGKLQVRPPRLNFGRFTRGATASLTFTIRNAGRGTLSGVVDQPDPQSNIPFFISQGAGTFTLAPRGTKRITVQFTSIPGRHEGVVQIRASDRSRPFQVRLTAVGQ
ncbi:MAG TPA: SBBP repeat-containing protein, partial [Armatimonadota bacterium]|nr:SBBP repeat-containing protein [Armatimonadota bacterium]